MKFTESKLENAIIELFDEVGISHIVTNNQIHLGICYTLYRSQINLLTKNDKKSTTNKFVDFKCNTKHLADEKQSKNVHKNSFYDIIKQANYII